MKILVINPNTSKEMSITIDSTAKKYASPKTEITTVNVKDGPEFIATFEDVVQQTPKVIKMIERSKDEYDYFVVACGANVGVEASRQVTQKVLGIGEVAYMTSCAVGKRFSIISPVKEAEEHLPLVLQKLGIDKSRCASARVVGNGLDDEIIKKRYEMLDTYVEIGRKCIDEDGADALVLICAGMGDLKEYLEERLNVPVTSGIESSVKLAELFGKI
jgi:allantoin racemase